MAPLVESLMVTLCVVEYVPATGLKVGVAAAVPDADEVRVQPRMS